MFWATNDPITNQIFYNTWFYMLQKVIDLYFMLKFIGYEVWLYNNVGIYNFHPIAK
jgi:hypothetical protein